MAEILVKAIDATNPDTEKDRRGCYKRGMSVVVMPDGYQWGAKEGLPTFIILKIPLIPVESVLKYTEPQYDEFGEVYRRRVWYIRWDDLPAAWMTIMMTTGQFIIKATNAYTGPSDATWTQARQYFRNAQTGQNESGTL